MALPSSGSISIAQIASELGLSLPLDLNDSRVRALAGKPSGNITMPDDFWGKSTRTVSMIGNMFPVPQGQFQYDSATLGIAVSDGVTPSSYAWNIVSDSGGFASLGPLTSGTPILRGPTYPRGTIGVTHIVVVRCITVVAGVSYTVNRTLNYNVQDGSGGA